MTQDPPPIAARVAAVNELCERVMSLDLIPAERDVAWPSAEPGAHIDVYLANGLVRQYSIYQATPDGRGYRIAVQLDSASRGGSAWLHQQTKVGDALSISVPRNAFPLVAAQRYLFIAGGIGITPIFSMLHAVRAREDDYKLFYCTRSAHCTAFRETLSASDHASSVRFIHDDGDLSRGLDLRSAIGAFDALAHLYCCGPTGLMSAVRQAASDLGWPESHLHFEYFKRSEELPAAGAHMFRIRIASTDEVFDVGPNDTVLEVLRAHDYIIDSSCEQGLCGTCRVGVLAGIVDHRDEVLASADKEANSAMTVCCSRAFSEELVLDL